MRRLLLVGGGHAHLEVLRSLALRPATGIEVVLLSPQPVQPYSSMLPGFLRQRFDAAEMTFDLPALAHRAGAVYREGAALRIEGVNRRVASDTGSLDFDFASIDVGSVPAGMETPGVAEHALPLRPWKAALSLRRRLDTASGSPDAFDAVVVGAGAGGVEVALAMARRLRHGRPRGARVVRLVEGAPRVLPELSSRARRLALAALAHAGVRVFTGSSVARVEHDRVVLESGEALSSSMTVWVTGAAPPPLIRASALPQDSSGYLLVDRTLRSVDAAPVYGAGDCIALEGHPFLPRAGVHAVRQAPVLTHNLRAALDGGAPRRYEPQSRFLALLDTADGRALLSYGLLAWRGRPVGWLKTFIDRRFMRRYRSLYAGG